MFLFWSHSCKRILVDNKLDDFNHELLVVLRTRIFRMTRILSLRLFCLSALSIFGRFVWFVFVSTLAWVVTNTNISNDTNFEPTALLLELNLYSVDSFDSCSFQPLISCSFKSRVFRGHPSATPVGSSSSQHRGQRRFRCSSRPWGLQPGQRGSLLAQTRHRR